MKNEKTQNTNENDETLDSDSEFQKWLKEHEKEDRERLMQFYDVWETD